MSMTCLMVLLVALGTCFLRKYVFDAYEGYVAVITIVGPTNGGKYRDVTIQWRTGFFTSLPVKEGQKHIFMSFCWHNSSADCISYIWRAHS